VRAENVKTGWTPERRAEQAAAMRERMAKRKPGAIVKREDRREPVSAEDKRLIFGLADYRAQLEAEIVALEETLAKKRVERKNLTNKVIAEKFNASEVTVCKMLAGYK